MSSLTGWPRPGPIVAAAGFLALALVAPALLVAGGQLVARHLPIAASTGKVTAGSTPDAATVHDSGTSAPWEGNVLLATPVRPRPVADPPFAAFQEFLSVCHRSGPGLRLIDGKLLPGEYFGTAPGRSDTSCERTADRSTYWMPVLRNNRKVIPPEVFETYYRSGVDDYTSVQAFPDGLVIMSADLKDRAGTGTQVSWECSHGPSPVLPASCPPGSRLHLRLQTPSCWDGRRLDSPDHASHMAFPARGKCPGTHPVAVPQLDLNIFYPLPEGATNLELGATARVWYRSAWKSGVLDGLITHCVNAGVRCPGRGARPD